MDAGIRICGNGGPVPVTLLSFAASPQKNAVFLFWQTAAEYQNDHFTIEKASMAGILFRLEEWPGMERLLLPNTINGSTIRRVKGMNFYRLRQVDTDNRFQLSRVIPVKFGSQDIVNAYYVPATHSIASSFLLSSHPTLLMLLSSLQANGLQGIQTMNSTLNVHLSLPVLADGVYTFSD